MSHQADSRKEYPSTYFVQDRSNQEEMRRLQIQDHLLTRSQGGVLPEHPAPENLQRVLDVASGTGDWLVSTAQAYPTIKLLVGGDVSQTFVNYARTQAEAARVNDRVEFHQMDALLILEFPTGFFDLVNLRLGSSFMRTWNWPKLLNEMGRVTQRGGILRLGDLEIDAQSTSPALTELYKRVRHALHRAGHLFTEAPDGLTAHLPRLLAQQGCQDVQTRLLTLEYRAGTPEGEACFDDAKHFFRTLRPFIHKWGYAGEDYDSLYQQMLAEVQHPDFHGTWKFLVTWGSVATPKEAAHA